jgi:hypothetical protein
MIEDMTIRQFGAVCPEADALNDGAGWKAVISAREGWARERPIPCLPLIALDEVTADPAS